MNMEFLLFIRWEDDNAGQVLLLPDEGDESAEAEDRLEPVADSLSAFFALLTAGAPDRAGP